MPEPCVQVCIHAGMLPFPHGMCAVFEDMYMPLAQAFCLQGRVSPTWESIDVKWQIFLMMCSTHSVTAYEVGFESFLTFSRPTLL